MCRYWICGTKLYFSFIDDEENLRISLGGFLFVILRSFFTILTNDSTCKNINVFTLKSEVKYHDSYSEY